ncbi:hypothetical protein H4I95_01647 [Botrytis cinerea]
MPQSTDFRSYQDTSEDSNTNMLQPEEWEGHREDAGVANPFHDVYQENIHPHSHQFQASGPPSGPPSISSSKYSTKSRSDLSCLPPPPLNPPTPSYKHRDQQANASSTKATTFSLYPTNHILPQLLPLPLINLATQSSTPFQHLPLMRICLDGNEGLAKLGETAIRLVMREQFYLFSIPEVQASQILNRILSRVSLSAYPTIASCIRPQPSIPMSFRNIIELVKEDTREDNTRIISRAVRAVIGAVYLDGGIESAKKIMENLQMGIKLPPGSKR